MAYYNKVKVKILVGKNAGEVAKATREKNFNTMNLDPIYVTDTEDEYLYSEHEVKVLDD
jgi:hypothetical protein